MLKKSICIAALLLLTLPLSGCWDNVVIEENTIITSIGIDETEPNEEPGKSPHKYIFVTVGSFNDKDKGDFTTVEADILSEALIKGNNRSVHPLRSAKLHSIVFNRQAAEHGYIPLVDTHKLEEVNRFLPDYMVSNTDALEIFNTLGKMGLQEKALTYLTDLVNGAAKSGYCPDISTYDFNLDFLSKGPDPMLPLLDIKNDTIFVKGTALFANDKMVGELTATESVFLNLIRNKKSSFSYYILFPLQDAAFDDAIFQTHKCNAKISTETQGDDLIINIDLEVNGYFDKFVWGHLQKMMSYEEINSYIKNYFNTNAKEVFTVLQSYKSDPCNVKGILKMNDYSFYNTRDFAKVYQKAKVNVNTDLDITNSPNPKVTK